MNRAQFMEQLEKLLSDISEEERQEALDYYESYFDDAGEDQEANVIRELGSPGKVAAIIKADLRESSQNYGEYTENGFQDDRVKEDMQMPEQVSLQVNNVQEAMDDIRTIITEMELTEKEATESSITVTMKENQKQTFLDELSEIGTLPDTEVTESTAETKIDVKVVCVETKQ